MAFSREVSLPSGGSIVIDHTEAMVTVDVNSARSKEEATLKKQPIKQIRKPRRNFQTIKN